MRALTANIKHNVSCHERTRWRKNKHVEAFIFKLLTRFHTNLQQIHSRSNQIIVSQCAGSVDYLSAVSSRHERLNIQHLLPAACCRRRPSDPVLPVWGDEAQRLLHAGVHRQLHRQRPGHVSEGGAGQTWWWVYCCCCCSETWWKVRTWVISSGCMKTLITLAAFFTGRAQIKRT